MQLILDRFGSNGSDELVAAHLMFQKIIAPLEHIYNIRPEWGGRVLMLYDAHDDDLLGVKIFPYACEKWFPELPGAVVAVHDCAIFTQPQTSLASYYYQAAYSPEINIVGFGEVPALVEYLKEKNLVLGLPGEEMRRLGIQGEGTSLIYF